VAIPHETGTATSGEAHDQADDEWIAIKVPSRPPMLGDWPQPGMLGVATDHPQGEFGL
jgi:hypothetical protein